MPNAVKVAVVLVALASVKLAAPGPLTLLHDVVNTPGVAGNPSSVAVPFNPSVALPVVWPEPALTSGPVSPNCNIILLSNQLVQYFVNVAASAAADLLGGRIVCATWGYFWPR